MKTTNEEAVTKLLTSNEILHINNANVFISNPFDSLGDFLKNFKSEPSPYEGKYMFIR